MREIKFRAWDKREKLMGEVNYIKFSKVQYTHISIRFKKGGKIVDEGYNYGAEDGSDNVILLQYTGLKDKNGKEIYEGDILQDRSGLLYLVKYNEHYAGFCIHDVFEGEVRDGINSFNEYIIKSHALKVIGNIYENKKMEVK